MAYLASERARERRKDPGLIQPGARSVLVLGMRYFAPTSLPEAPADQPRGRVAAYAWGDDYHEIIPPRLEALAQVLENAIGQSFGRRAYTDTGPILERDFAQRAGLGWAGKNTCLIDPRSGSYYLLGELFVDVEIEPASTILTDHCGTCTRCIDACPTDAIRGDRTIESGRCISYLTIENKGSIPLELREGMGDWIFGCDICQAVCPWNMRFAASQGHPALSPRPDVPMPALSAELRLAPQDFNRKFRRSPILRAKRRGYLRNVAVALGNARDPSTAPDLIHTLHNEPEPLVRAHAAWALGRIATLTARSALEKAQPLEIDKTARAEIAAALDGNSGA
jgi:epoxyqueuosine reductase